MTPSKKQSLFTPPYAGQSGADGKPCSTIGAGAADYVIDIVGCAVRHERGK